MLAMAQSAFDGTWKIDLNKLKMPQKPSVLLLQNGTFQCTTCIPAIKVKADGTDQPGSGNPYFDMMAVKIVDDHTILETEKKAGKVVSDSTTTAADDGRAAAFEFTDNNTKNPEPVTGKGTMTRAWSRGRPARTRYPAPGARRVTATSRTTR